MLTLDSFRFPSFVLEDGVCGTYPVAIRAVNSVSQISSDGDLRNMALEVLTPFIPTNEDGFTNEISVKIERDKLQQIADDFKANCAQVSKTASAGFQMLVNMVGIARIKLNGTYSEIIDFVYSTKSIEKDSKLMQVMKPTCYGYHSPSETVCARACPFRKNCENRKPITEE